MVLATEGHETPQVQDLSGTLGPDAQPADVPCQPDVPSVNNELSQVPVRPRRERREPLWLKDYVRTVSFTLRGRSLLLEQLLINF